MVVSTPICSTPPFLLFTLKVSLQMRTVLYMYIAHQESSVVICLLWYHCFNLWFSMFSRPQLHEEFVQMMNGLKFNASRPRRGIKFLSNIKFQVPDAIDWRDEGYVTPIKDQVCRYSSMSQLTCCSSQGPFHSYISGFFLVSFEMWISLSLCHHHVSIADVPYCTVGYCVKYQTVSMSSSHPLMKKLQVRPPRTDQQ